MAADNGVKKSKIRGAAAAAVLHHDNEVTSRQTTDLHHLPVYININNNNQNTARKE